MPRSENEEPLLPPQATIKNRWRIERQVGQGAFGQIYRAFDMQHNMQRVAIKVERWDSRKSVLKLEVVVLKKMQFSPYSCRYLHCGHQNDINYLVMELVGENLSELRRKMPAQCFSTQTTALLGIEMIKAIRDIHAVGFLHRDIKPSNFVTKPQADRRAQIIMIDFGLARKYRSQDGSVRPPRKDAGFRGTARYASVNSHLSKELSRRDDLWSLFYVLIEFATGVLPWRKMKDKEDIGMMKMRYNNRDLVASLPDEFAQFLMYVQKLEYESEPDYEYVLSLLRSMAISAGCTAETLFDWEQPRDANAAPQNGVPGLSPPASPKAVMRSPLRVAVGHDGTEDAAQVLTGPGTPRSRIHSDAGVSAASMGGTPGLQHRAYDGAGVSPRSGRDPLASADIASSRISVREGPDGQQLSRLSTSTISSAFRGSVSSMASLGSLPDARRSSAGHLPVQNHASPATEAAKQQQAIATGGSMPLKNTKEESHKRCACAIL